MDATSCEQVATVGSAGVEIVAVDGGKNTAQSQVAIVDCAEVGVIANYGHVHTRKQGRSCGVTSVGSARIVVIAVLGLMRASSWLLADVIRTDVSIVAVYIGVCASDLGKAGINVTSETIIAISG